MNALKMWEWWMGNSAAKEKKSTLSKWYNVFAKSDAMRNICFCQTPIIHNLTFNQCCILDYLASLDVRSIECQSKSLRDKSIWIMISGFCPIQMNFAYTEYEISHSFHVLLFCNHDYVHDFSWSYMLFLPSSPLHINHSHPKKYMHTDIHVHM